MADVYDEMLAILQDLFSDRISTQEAVRDLASTTLSVDPPQYGLYNLWSVIVTCACESSGYHDKIVELLVQLSKLPSEDILILYDMQIWKDLPTLGWALRDHRQSVISKIINRDKFTALLMATEEPVFVYLWFTMFTLRDALEIPIGQLLLTHPLEAIPSAAIGISTLGVGIYEWDKDLSGYPGIAPGRGGPLWEGKHGFFKERWQLWRKRFGEVARMGEIGDEARKAAREAEQMMLEIENGEIE